MSINMRSHLIAGCAVVAVGVIAIPPAAPVPTPTATASHERQTDVWTAPRIDVAAFVSSIISKPPNPAHVAAARAAIERIDPAAAAAAATRQSTVAAAVAATTPVTLGAVSTGIDAAYRFVVYLADNAVQLAKYVYQFIPSQLLPSLQIDILLYQNLIQPIAHSIVYGLIIPVVNDPLNPASYANGLANVGQTSVNAAINTGIAEFNHFFGWLVPPLPPLPLAAKTLASPAVSTPLAAGLERTAGVPAAPTKTQPQPTVVTADLPTTPASARASHQSADGTTPAGTESADSTEPDEATVPNPAGTTSTEASAHDGQGGDPSGADSNGDQKKAIGTTHTPKPGAGDKHSARKGPAKKKSAVGD